MDYGERIRAAREARGLTQFDLGIMIGRRDGDVSRWERGVLLPKIGTFVELTRALGVSLDYLAGLTDQMRLDPAWSNAGKDTPTRHLERLPPAPVAASPPRKAPPRARSR